jgi:hypothetical protein
MGRLTDDMGQLRRNIDSTRESRLAQQNARKSGVSAQLADFAATRTRNGRRDAKARVTFVTHNANDVNRLLSAFHHLHQMMGRHGRKERADFVNNLSKKTLGLLTGFNADHKSMAERSARERADFIAKNSSSVAAFINDAAQDRAGAHAVFFGTATAKKKSSIPSIAIRVIDETHTDAPPPHAKVSDQKVEAAVFEHTNDNKTKKPNKQPGKFFGIKKGKE